MAHIADRGVGDIVIQRLGYATRPDASFFPLDAMLNLPSCSISYPHQKHLILEVVNNSFHDVLDAIARWTGVTLYFVNVTFPHQQGSYPLVVSLSNEGLFATFIANGLQGHFTLSNEEQIANIMTFSY